MNNMKRPLIVHFHIFKNGGSTIDWILKKNFGEKAGLLDTNNPGGILSNEDISKYLIEHNDLISLSSHQLRFPLPPSEVFNYIPIIFIRHPIDRAFSVYSHCKRSTDEYIFNEKAHNLSMKEFFEWYFNFDSCVMSDFQVVSLSRLRNYFNLTTQDLDLAIKRIEECPIIGVVDRMDESLVIAEHTLKPYFNNIDLSYIIQNVSLDRTGNMDERIRIDRLQVGKSIMEKIIDSNYYDLQLYMIANKILDKRIGHIEDFESKLANFKKRKLEKN